MIVWGWLAIIGAIIMVVYIVYLAGKQMQKKDQEVYQMSLAIKENRKDAEIVESYRGTSIDDARKRLREKLSKSTKVS